MTMRVAMLYDVDDIRIESRAVPQLRDGELLVQTRASGICSGDIMGWYVRRKAPLVLGHEPAGTIVAVGGGAPPTDDDGRAFVVGERVAVHHHAPCFACVACRRGDHVQCATWRASAIEPGGLAEYFRVPRENVRDTLRLPDAVSFADGSLVEPLGCVMKSIRRSGLRSGDNVLVIGLGVMGLMHVAVARDRGARAFGTDFRAERRAYAETLGAAMIGPDDIAALKRATDGRGAEVVICGPGTPEALRNAIAAAAPGGTIVMFTPLEPGVALSLDPNDLYFRDLRLIASYSCGPEDTREALAAIARGVVTVEKLHATTFPLEQAAQAYRALAEAQIVKPIVIFEPSLFD
ncbi:MAG TPA: alcohol dehydrogenase catalytic domain-containing protein [Verrucomicrobiae bacterium]|jgi:L-iditol 2-dehydrogenase|nr:alcohol dehydrogenase catalytic domain-containing protein [Verrucomicrobiae bacterium]